VLASESWAITGHTGRVLITADWVVEQAGVTARRNGAVRVVGDRVTEVGLAHELMAQHPNDEVVDGSGCVLMPGFVNAHVHLYGVLAHGIPLDNAPSGFWSFLDDFWWPKVEDSLDLEMITTATEWVCAEMLRSGITTFYDILEAPNALPGALLAQRDVVERLGMRGFLSFEATERVSAANGQLGLRENVELIEECRRNPGLVNGLMCYHTTFTCPEPFIRQAFELAADLDVLCHAHVNEGVHEGIWAEANLGMRTFEFYDHIGVAGPNMLASQCVQLSEREREIIAEREVRCVHMPLANCEVGGGIAPIPEQLAAGVTMGLGSDGYVNDFFEVMRGSFMLHKGRLQDPGVMPAGQVLALATTGGAQALNLPDVGRLTPGSAADLQLVDARFPTPITEHNLADQLVLYRNHSHVRDVMVAGAWRVRNSEVLGVDLEALRARVHVQAERLWAKA
jgi:5-methylthioadenosine/S-adenosylhomocysteine deaminase